MDDLEITGAPCEAVVSPSISYNFNPLPCYANQPQVNRLEADSPPNNYPVGVLAADTASPFDTGIDSVVAIYRVNRGPWDTITVPSQHAWCTQ
ncbi:MAG: hypothetical protein U5L96_05620 [Owenweeksia sp.]|nr:hypothetical protein [Owenweeksia sp.]